MVVWHFLPRDCQPHPWLKGRPRESEEAWTGREDRGWAQGQSRPCPPGCQRLPAWPPGGEQGQETSTSNTTFETLCEASTSCRPGVQVSAGCWLSCSTREMAGLALCWSRTVVKTGPPSNHKSKGGGSLGRELATSCRGAEAQVLSSHPGPQFRRPLMSLCSLSAAACFSILKNIPGNGFEVSAVHIPCSI